ncbi:GNAT family N-acetyltransferase [Arcobacter sp.]|uniref:GNAT family N-acetyltransferase n=1 Tax=Arcobacter sp. TaxID=1872629 RepID=UPI003C70FEBC
MELFNIIKARESVFVVEQQCPYQETDDMDLHSWHLIVSIENELVAYVRVVDPKIKYEQPSIGRVLTLEKFRNLKIGRSLMNEAIRFTEEQFPNMGIKIGAQIYLQNFYESLGFEAASEVYDEDGIPHIDMIKRK